MKICKISILLILLFTSINILNAQEIHVNPTGKDSNPGTKANPVATLEAAKKLVRQLISNHKIVKGGVRVIIHEGTYDLKNTFVLDEKDNGEPGKPITWMAESGKKVSITGSKTIGSGNFSRVTDKAILNRIEPEVREKLMQLDLKSVGVNNLGKHKQYGHSLPVIPAPLELFFDEEPMTLARYPNKGMIKIGKVIDKGSVPRTGDKSNRGAIFNYTDARHEKWVGQKNIWIQGTFNYGFADDYIPVDYIDTLTKTLKLAKPHLYGVNTGRDFQTYIAINILEELDTPGEWYADEKTSMLYFWPPANMENSVIQVSMLEEPIIALEGVKNVQLKGLTIEGGRGIGIYMERCNNTLVAGCTVRNVGTSGIFMGQGAKLIDDNSSVDDYEGIAVSREVGSFQNHMYKYNTWNRNAGENNRILSCDVYNTGSGGISLSGGDKKTLTPGNNVVENCKVHDFNRRNKFTWSGINVDGCGNKLLHNEVYNSDFHGIFVHGNEHLFEYNHVHDVTRNSDDTSPWYIGRNPSNRGNILRYNYFHDCGSASKMNMGIYCDDSSTDVFIFGNVFSNMNTNHGVVFSNGGWDIVMKNNIVVNPISHTGVVSALYYSWAAPQAKEFFDEGGLLRKRLEKEINYKSPPYSTKYPSLMKYLDVITAGKEWQGMRAQGNLLADNVIVGGPENPIDLLGGQYAQMEGKNNFVTKEDPGFIDMKNGNFNLKPDSKVFKLIPGFQKILFDKMGIYKDEYRK
jgi:hypothetical protein